MLHEFIYEFIYMNSYTYEFIYEMIIWIQCLYEIRQTDKLALLPLVKRQVFCVGDRLKMDKHKAWATTIVAPKSVGSSTTKGQMKPTFRVSLTASQAGENSQISAPEHTNVSSILTYLTFRRNQGRRTAPSGPTIESAKQPTSNNEFQNSNSTQYHPKLPTQKFNLRFLGLKTK